MLNVATTLAQDSHEFHESAAMPNIDNYCKHPECAATPNVESLPEHTESCRSARTSTSGSRCGP